MDAVLYALQWDIVPGNDTIQGDATNVVDNTINSYVNQEYLTTPSIHM